MSNFYSSEELKKLGFEKVGKDVLLSKRASIYSPQHISIGNNVRIDDFCLLSGHIQLGSHIHISAGVYLYGGDAGIKIEDFAGISPKGLIMALSDDFSGQSMTNSMIPLKFRNVLHKAVHISKFSQIGACSNIGPGVFIGEGAIVGANSFVKKNIPAWEIHAGVPAKKIGERKKDLLTNIDQFLSEYERI